MVDADVFECCSESMSDIKIHITLRPEIANDPERREAALEEIQRVSGLREVNRKRFERYGLVSGVVNENKSHEIRNLGSVASAEADQERFLASDGNV